MTTEIDIDLAPKLHGLFVPEVTEAGKKVRYRIAKGGRGGAKTMGFALMAAIKGYEMGKSGRKGQILCARQYMNSLDDSSLEEIKHAIRSQDWLTDYYDVGERYIRSKDGNIQFTFAGLAKNMDSLKSKAKILLCWVDEAESVLEIAWRKLLPSVREADSEVWISYNPEHKRSATHQRFIEDPPPNAIIIDINWRDNPWFPDVLNEERLEDKRKRPDQYEHVWEGAFLEVNESAYYSALIKQARRDGRVGHVAADPLMTIRAVFDIGGTGAKSDAAAIWVVQYVGREIRFLDFYEAQGQPLATHVNWLRENGYGNALCVLPHDGKTNDKVHDVSYESALREAGFEVKVVPNQGKGAAKQRVEALRRLLPSCFFSSKCEGGLEALQWYHEKIDEERGIGLGPNHDWSSHAADAAGLAAIDYADAAPKGSTKKKKFRRRKGLL